MKGQNKWRSVVLISLGIVVVAFAALLVYLNAHVEDLLRKQIEIHSAEDLEINFKSISINALTQSAEIDRIEVSKKDTGYIDWSASIDKLFIKELSVIKLLKGDGLKLDSVVISGLSIDVHQVSERKAHQKSETQEKRPKSKLPVQIDGIRISSGNFDYDPKGPTLATGNFSFLLRNFQHDSSAVLDLNGHFLNTEFTIGLDQMVTKDSLYSCQIQSISKTFGDTIVIDSLLLSPLRTLAKFTRHHGWNKGMLGIEVREVKTQINLTSFRDSILIPFCSVSQSKINIQKDNRWPVPNRTTLMPQEMLSSLPIKFRLDSFLISEAQIEIELIQEDGKVASLSIENVEANLTIQNLNEEAPALAFSTKQAIMGEAMATVEATYYYGNSSPFDLALTMENSELEIMSDFLQKSIGIRITEGQLNQLDLNMTGNKYASRGEVIFEYTDLSIAAVDKETGKEKKMLNAVANVLGSLVFWSDNPANDNYRTGTFSVERDVRKAFLSQWVEGLEAGIVNIVAKIDPLKMRGKSEKKNQK